MDPVFVILLGILLVIYITTLQIPTEKKKKRKQSKEVGHIASFEFFLDSKGDMHSKFKSVIDWIHAKYGKYVSIKYTNLKTTQSIPMSNSKNAHKEFYVTHGSDKFIFKAEEGVESIKGRIRAIVKKRDLNQQQEQPASPQAWTLDSRNYYSFVG
jgi:hypothetical protein